MNKTNSRVALVTGASSGIGKATANALMTAGYRVFGTSRRAAAETPGRITMLTCDVTDDKSVAKLIESVLADAGRIDLLVNNAGVGLLGGAEEFLDRPSSGAVRCERFRRSPSDQRGVADHAPSEHGQDRQHQFDPGPDPITLQRPLCGDQACRRRLF